MDYEALRVLITALNDSGVEYILVGGIALGIHGLIRTTEDVDVFVDPAPPNIEKLKAALRSVWNDPEIQQISSTDLSGNYPTVRYGPPGVSFVIDLISRLGSAVEYNNLEYETRDFGGVPVRVATARALYNMKKNTVRPIDQADAAALRQKFGFKED